MGQFRTNSLTFLIMSDTVPPTTVWQGLPPSMQAIHTRLAQVLPVLVAQLRPDASFAECGGDSIDFVELLCVIEADYGVRLSTDEITSLQTIGELLLLVDQRASKRPASAP
jgi:acyl carrier protein